MVIHSLIKLILAEVLQVSSSVIKGVFKQLCRAKDLYRQNGRR